MSEVCNVHVQKHDKNPISGHTEFFLKIFYLGREWGIRKRYSDFLHFDDYLRRSGVSVDYKLPPKNWWNRYDRTLLAARLKALQLYINALLSVAALGENSLVREFLEVDTINIKELRKAASFRRLDYFDRLHAIVEQTNKKMISMKTTSNLGSCHNATRHAASAVRIRSNSALSLPMNRPADRGGSPIARSGQSSSLSPAKSHISAKRAASKDSSSTQARPSALAFANSFSGGGCRKNNSGGESDRTRLSSQEPPGGVGLLVEAVADAQRREHFLLEAGDRFIALGGPATFTSPLPVPAAAPTSPRLSIERHSASSSGSVSGKVDRSGTSDRGSIDTVVTAPAEVVALLSEPLLNLRELQQALDDYADSLLEGSLQSQLLLGGHGDLVLHFRNTKDRQRLLKARTSFASLSPASSTASASSVAPKSNQKDEPRYHNTDQ